MIRFGISVVLLLSVHARVEDSSEQEFSPPKSLGTTLCSLYATPSDYSADRMIGQAPH